MSHIISAYDKYYRSKCNVRNIHGCGVILFDTQLSHIVIVKQNGSAKWGLPKGHMTNTCEQYFRCAKREMYDETGVNLNNISYMKYGTIILNERLFYILSLKKIKKIYLRPKDHVEISDSIWMDVNSLIFRVSPNELNKTLRDFVKLMQFQMNETDDE